VECTARPAVQPELVVHIPPDCPTSVQAARLLSKAPMGIDTAPCREALARVVAATAS
jgi:hypothetical protein